MTRKYLLLMLLAVLLPILAACAGVGAPADGEQPVARPAGWSEETHGLSEPNYGVVFPQDKVNQLTIQISPERWAAMQANMKDLFGAPGQGGRFLGGPGEKPGAELPVGEDGLVAGEAPEVRPFPPDTTPVGGGKDVPAPGEGGGAPPAGGVKDMVVVPEGEPGEKRMVRGELNNENPDWFEATITFDGKTWSNVGVRYKGNSSLVGSWHGGSLKLPLKLDFDQFEDEHPEIADQRFYGFKQLSLSNNHGDASHMREALTYELLAQAGLPASKTAYYEVVLDYGEGPKSLGLYTAIEVVDDTLLERAFGDDGGNIYEGDGPAASLAEGTREQIPSSFEKENNKQSDWSDVEALYGALHDPTRTSDPAAWRARLEAIFDVDVFLEWLALSAAVSHWDTYGGLAHNYYLYNNPATGRLTWISWDHNFVLGGAGGMVKLRLPGPDGKPVEGPRGGPTPTGGVGDQFIVVEPAPGEEPGPGQGDVVGGPGGEGARHELKGAGPASALDRSDVDDEWPLIRYLLDDPTYYARYEGYLRETAASTFSAAALEPRIQQLAALLRPYAAKEEGGEAAFDEGLKDLRTRIAEREKAVADFLAGKK